MSNTLILRQVHPTGSVRVRTLHGVVSVIDEYPDTPSGKALRARRHELSLTLREAAKLLGLTATELSRLEVGSAVTDWKLAMTKLNGVA